MPPELVRRTRRFLPNLKLVQVYGLIETGFLTGLQDHEHTEDKLILAGDLALEPMSWSWTNQEGKLKPDKQVSWPLAAPTSCAVIGTNRKKPTSPFETGWFGPGTIGFQDANVYFYILDRVKDMIVTGGENVYSGEVEAVIYGHPAVREVVVFGRPDPRWGKS